MYVHGALTNPPAARPAKARLDEPAEPGKGHAMDGARLLR